VRALGKQCVKTFVLAHDPDTVILLEFVADLANGVIGGIAGFESGRRLKEHAWKSGADKTENREEPQRPETTPSKPT